jgi:diguanylate cyclase (GGDEF)-like protein
MKKIWEFYENMNEFVYASDVESHEIVYMNRKAREYYGFSSVNDLKGKKCYEVLQGNLSPCAMCTNQSLKLGQFEERKKFDLSTNTAYLLEDTKVGYDGREYRMQMAIGIPSEDMELTESSRIANHEAIINEALRRALSTSVPDQSIDILLEYLGLTFKSDRVYIFEENPDHSFNNTYEWCAKGVVPQKQNLQNIPEEAVSLWLERFRDEHNVIIRDLEKTKESDPLVYDYLAPQDIRSLVVSPLIINDRIIGFYGVDNPPVSFLQNISGLLHIMGHFTISLLKSRNLIKKLENMSFYDQLTGFGNRHAMDKYVAEADPDESIGIIYCDVMGLKTVNDEKGHHAGDQLIIRACRCIEKAFPDYSRFRIGGDEFLVLCKGISEEALSDRAALLKSYMKENSALMALGCVWHPNSADSIDRLLAEADKRMYDDKRAYYSANDRRRR